MANYPSKTPSRIKLGNYDLDVPSGIIERAGHVFKLSPQSVDCLIFLAENHGRTITRNEFMDSVWAGRIVTDSQLTKCISEIRTALGDQKSRIAMSKLYLNEATDSFAMWKSLRTMTMNQLVRRQ